MVALLNSPKVCPCTHLEASEGTPRGRLAAADWDCVLQNEHVKDVVSTKEIIICKKIYVNMKSASMDAPLRTCLGMR